MISVLSLLAQWQNFEDQAIILCSTFLKPVSAEEISGIMGKTGQSLKWFTEKELINETDIFLHNSTA